MINLDQLRHTADRVKKADAPDRALDVRIAVAVDWRPSDWEPDERTAREMADKHSIDWLVSRSTDGIASIWRHIPRFTASRDAVISLLPAGKRRIEFGSYENGTGWAYVWTLEPSEGVGEADGATEELAVCAAALEALIAANASAPVSCE